MLCDLHIHTAFSDGCLSPAGVVAAAAETGIACLAVTDHDTMAGVPEAQSAAEARGIHVISGVEFSSGPNGETHILSYGVPPGSPAFSRYFDQLREERVRRALKTLRRLEDAAGIHLDDDAVLNCPSSSIGRPHIARMLVQGGFCRDTGEAFERYLARGRCGYVPRSEKAPSAIIRMIRGAGGVPVLAHPAQLSLDDAALDARVAEWADDGLQGLEVYHPSNARRYGFFASLAARHHLLITGGSDFHDFSRPTGPIGCTSGAWVTAGTDVPSLLSLIRKNIRT